MPLTHAPMLALLLAAALGCGESNAPTPRVPPGERSWGAPQEIETTELAYGAKLAFDPQGDAMLAWDDLDGRVNAKHYDAEAEAWGPSQILDRDNPEDAALPSIGVAADGSGIAVWQRQSQVDDRRSVWTNRYDAATGAWGAAQQIQNSDLVLLPQLAMDRAGNAVTLFTVADIGAGVANARFQAERGTWSPAEPVAPATGVLAGGPRVAMTPSGEGVAIWMDRVRETSATLWVARYATATETWSEVQALAPEAEMLQPSGVAINQAGTAVAVWVQLAAERFTVWTSRSSGVGAAWSTPERIDRDATGDALLPAVVIDAAGHALSAWSADEALHQTVWANRYGAASGAWGGAEAISAPDADAMAPSLDVDGAGNVLALWTRTDASRRRSPRVRWYVADGGTWLPEVSPETDTGGDAWLGEVAVMDDGRALLVWQRGDQLMGSHFR